jgi:hypothetical protein
MNEPVELCDETGNTVGRFLPGDDYVNLLYEIAKNEPVDETELMLAREEIQRDGGMSTTEVLASLDKVVRNLKGKP